MTNYGKTGRLSDMAAAANFAVIKIIRELDPHSYPLEDWDLGMVFSSAEEEIAFRSARVGNALGLPKNMVGTGASEYMDSGLDLDTSLIKIVYTLSQNEIVNF